MSYRAGIRGLAHLGLPDGDPHIFCDRCGVRRSMTRPTTGSPYAWFFDGKAAPGWQCIYDKATHTRTDYCQNCKAVVGARGTR